MRSYLWIFFRNPAGYRIGLDVRYNSTNFYQKLVLMKIEDFQGWSFLPVQFHLCQVNSVAFRSRLCNRTFFSPDLLMKISNFAKTPFDLNKILQLFYTQRCYCVRNGIKIILKGSWKQVGTLFFNILIRVRLFYRPSALVACAILSFLGFVERFGWMLN